MARLSRDPGHAPDLAPAERERLDGMTDADITAAALDDADNQPLSEEELGKRRSARLVRQARRHSGLSQAAFARTYQINVARLRDLEHLSMRGLTPAALAMAVSIGSGAAIQPTPRARRLVSNRSAPHPTMWARPSAPHTATPCLQPTPNACARRRSQPPLRRGGSQEAAPGRPLLVIEWAAWTLSSPCRPCRRPVVRRRASWALRRWRLRW